MKRPDWEFLYSLKRGLAVAWFALLTVVGLLFMLAVFALRSIDAERKQAGREVRARW